MARRRSTPTTRARTPPHAATGEFTLAFNDGDIRLLGVDYNNQDFSISTTGPLSRTLPNATSNLGSGNSLLRLVAGGVVPFEWVAAPNGTGRTFGALPSTADGFAALEALGRDELPDRAAVALATAAEVCVSTAAVRARLERLVAPAVAAGAEDARAQLDRRVRPGSGAASGPARTCRAGGSHAPRLIIRSWSTSHPSASIRATKVIGALCRLPSGPV